MKEKNQKKNNNKKKEEKWKSKFKLDFKLKFPSFSLHKKPKIDKRNKEVIDFIKRRIKQSESEYETDFDKLLDLVKIYKRLKISDVAKGFDVDKEKIEEWGTILEERELLKLYYPTFGEAELRSLDFSTKEIQPVKKSKKKKIIINLIVILIVVVACTFLILKGEKKVFIPLKVTSPSIISAAFSGTGSYECDMKKGDISIHYWIKDKKIRIATVTAGQTTISIFIEDYMYTFLATKDEWIKVKIPETIVVPGSGKLPQEKITCERSTIDDAKFKIREDKIRSV